MDNIKDLSTLSHRSGHLVLVVGTPNLTYSGLTPYASGTRSGDRFVASVSALETSARYHSSILKYSSQYEIASAIRFSKRRKGITKKKILPVLLLLTRSECQRFTRSQANENGVKSYCLSKCHPGFATFLYVSEHGSRRQLRLSFLLLGPCRSQLRLPRCMRTHLTGPLLTHVRASKPCERADIGARL